MRGQIDVKWDLMSHESDYSLFDFFMNLRFIMFWTTKPENIVSSVYVSKSQDQKEISVVFHYMRFPFQVKTSKGNIMELLCINLYFSSDYWAFQW